MAVGFAVVIVVAVIVALLVRTDGDDQAVRTDTSTTTEAGSPTTATPTSALTSEVPTSAAAAAGPCDPAAAISQWSLRRRLGQLLMIGVTPTSAEGARQAAASGVGGVFVERTPKSTAVYTSGGLKGLKTPDGVPLAVAADDEGGVVQSIESLDGNLPSARKLSDAGPEEIERLVRVRASRLKSYGVTIDLAPVVDLDDDDQGVIGTRSFSPDPAVATADALAFARGLRSEGLTPVFKHFPGHGRASGDSHKSTVTTPPLAELKKHDLVPYQTVLKEPGAWVMLGHLDVPGLTNGEPASVSPEAIALLRDGFGFDGVVMSDELAGMAAITGRYPLAEAIRRFLDGGGDVALWNGPTASIASVLKVLEADVKDGSLDETKVNAAVQKVLAAKSYDPCAAT